MVVDLRERYHSHIPDVEEHSPTRPFQRMHRLVSVVPQFGSFELQGGHDIPAHSLEHWLRVELILV